MRYVNLTPHTIVYQKGDGTTVSFPSEGVARVAEKVGYLLSTEDGIYVYSAPTMGLTEGLPLPVEGVTYIVSGIVRNALAGQREDVVSPGTGPNDGAIRAAGQIVAVTRFIQG
jgi:hypothetical protein